MARQTKKMLSRKPTARIVHESEGAVSGALVGGLVGAAAGPAGVVAGAVMGAVAGTLAGAVLDDDATRNAAHERELDAPVDVGTKGGGGGADEEA
ncbi:MAG TPA: hypothetical protein VGM06_07035 [Polyangiaceae bacterium]|jgi:uncharacterized membrane protein